MNAAKSPIQPQRIEEAILLVRGQRVMLERDLAALYGVETKNLNKALSREAKVTMPNEFQYDDFLSYNTADKPRVRRLAERLRADGRESASQ